MAAICCSKNQIKESLRSFTFNPLHTERLYPMYSHNTSYVDPNYQRPSVHVSKPLKFAENADDAKIEVQSMLYRSQT